MNDKLPFDLILFDLGGVINVDGARAVGMAGHTVSGVSDVCRKIDRLGLLEPPRAKPQAT